MNAALYRIFLITIYIFFTVHSPLAFSSKTQQVAPITTGVTLESDSSLYWLHFDKDADSLWPLLKNFWEKQGIALDKEQPKLGYIQTTWIDDPESSKFRSIFFSDKAPEFRERFRLRVERLANNAGTRVFIHHSSYGILFDEEAVYSGYLPPSPELEIEMLSRLALFSGADQKQIKSFTSTYSPIKLQAISIDNEQYEIRMPGSLTFVSKKLITVLDRLNIDFKTKNDTTIIASISDSSNLTDKKIEKQEQEWGIDDSSDLEESGFDYNPQENTKKANTEIYEIKLATEASYTIIHIRESSKNSRNELRKFSRAVARNLSK